MKLLVAATDRSAQTYARKAAESAGLEVVVVETLQEAMEVLENNRQGKAPLVGALVSLNLYPMNPARKPVPPAELAYDGPGEFDPGPYPSFFNPPRQSSPAETSEWMYSAGAPVGLFVAALSEKVGVPFVLYRVEGQADWSWPDVFVKDMDWSLTVLRPGWAHGMREFMQKAVRELMDKAQK